MEKRGEPRETGFREVGPEAMPEGRKDRFRFRVAYSPNPDRVFAGVRYLLSLVEEPQKEGPSSGAASEDGTG